MADMNGTFFYNYSHNDILFSRGFTDEPTKRSNTELFPFVCEIDSLDVSKTLLRQFSVEPPNNVCQRNDTLASPSVSPVSWMLLHKCKTANDRASSSGKIFQFIPSCRRNTSHIVMLVSISKYRFNGNNIQPCPRVFLCTSS